MNYGIKTEQASIYLIEELKFVIARQYFVFFCYYTSITLKGNYQICAKGAKFVGHGHGHNEYTVQDKLI